MYPPVKPRVEILRTHTEAIREHKANCPKCIDLEQQKLEQTKLKLEGPLRVQYILMVMAKAIGDIRFAKDKKEEAEKKRAKGQELDGLEQEKLRLALYDGGVAEETIKKERAELRKLLNDENEVIRTGATKEYLRYVDRMKQLKKEKEAVTPA